MCSKYAGPAASGTCVIGSFTGPLYAFCLRCPYAQTTLTIFDVLSSAHSRIGPRGCALLRRHRARAAGPEAGAAPLLLRTRVLALHLRADVPSRVDAPGAG